MAHPLDAYLLAKGERGRFVLVTTDAGGNKVFLCGCTVVGSREEATHYSTTNSHPRRLPATS